MRRGWVMAGAALLAIGVLAFAWIDGGRQPVRTIRQSLPVPELPR